MIDDTPRHPSTSLERRREAFEEIARAARNALDEERSRRNEKNARLKAGRQQAQTQSSRP